MRGQERTGGDRRGQKRKGEDRRRQEKTGGERRGQGGDRENYKCRKSPLTGDPLTSQYVRIIELSIDGCSSISIDVWLKSHLIEGLRLDFNLRNTRR